MSSDIQSNNKRIARNTMMLYIRMGITMLVGLYTSRVVLQVLGVSDSRYIWRCGWYCSIYGIS